MKNRQFLKFLLVLYKPVRFLAATMAISMILMQVFSASKQFVVKAIIDLPNSAGGFSVEKLYGLIFWLILITVVGLAFFYLSNILRAVVIRKIQEPYIANLLFTDLSRRNHSFFLDNHSGKIASSIDEISSEVTRLNATFSNSAGFVSYLAMMITNLMLIYSVDFMAFIVATVVFSLIIIIRIIYFQKRYLPLSKEANNFSREYVGILNDSVMNFSSIRIYSAIEDFAKKLKNRKFESVKLNVRASVREVSFGFYANVIYTIIFVIMIFVMVGKIQSGEVTLGGLVIFLNAMSSIKNDTTLFAWSYLEMADKLVRLKSCFELLYSGDISDDFSKKDIKIKNGQIEFKDLNFGFEGNEIFRDFNLVIENKQKIGIIGESGSGKSTLMSLLLKLYSPNDGKILIDGKDISCHNSSSLYREIAYVSQETILLHDTILENIKIAKLNATDEEIFEATKKAQLHDFIISLENGYGTIVGERGMRLSGGQRQRISLARTFLRNSKIVVFDEATSALDNKTEALIQENIDKNFENQTIICVAHRLSTLQNMDKILVLKKGKIVDFGEPKDIITKYDKRR
ncbi:MAG: ABC transporter ATP-binding protein [bacterium]|nr:ABC transporter ATP-binding protein [bacterium]